MSEPIDPMSAEAQDMMDEFNTRIVANARRRIWEQKRDIRAYNDQRMEE